MHRLEQAESNIDVQSRSGVITYVINEKNLVITPKGNINLVYKMTAP